MHNNINFIYDIITPLCHKAATENLIKTDYINKISSRISKCEELSGYYKNVLIFSSFFFSMQSNFIIDLGPYSFCLYLSSSFRLVKS